MAEKHMPMATIPIDGNTLSLEQMYEVAARNQRVELSLEAQTRVNTARALVEEVATGEKPAYGINTGFGTLAEVRINKHNLRNLQRNLLVSHAAGVGHPLSQVEARALLLLRCNVLAKGFSGIRLSTLELGISMLNRGVTPLIPERGSVGASGDLAPLAHLALVFIGEGTAFFEGVQYPGREALSRAGLSPVILEAKEGLALVNGTQAMCAVGALALLEAEKLAELFDVAGAMAVEGLLCSHTPFIEAIYQLRPHYGHGKVSAHLRALLDRSELLKTHVDCGRVQDPYSLRCIPQVHGTARDALAFARKVLETEVNAGTDNPIVFTETKSIISAGNFHGQPVSLALDMLAIALTQLQSISERRVEHMVNPTLSGLPAFLVEDSGINSGFMIAQVTAASLVAESRILCHPASIDSIPSSASREDHVSMGMTAALKARQVVTFATHVAAIEILVASQALDYRMPIRAGRGVQAAYECVRAHVPHLAVDRELHKDIACVTRIIQSGELLQTVRQACRETVS